MTSNGKNSGAASFSETEITLGLLHAVHENSAHTQRSLAQELGVALGLANAYLKRCVKKGLIKVNQVPANRYAYYLTPKGFVEKSRLTAEYLSQSVSFFRSARTESERLFMLCESKGWTKVALAGVGELCEIASLCSHDTGVDLLGVIEEGFADKAFSGVPVLDEAKGVAAADAVIVTDMRDPQGRFERLAKILPEDRVLALPLLKVSRTPPNPEN